MYRIDDMKEKAICWVKKQGMVKRKKVLVLLFAISIVFAATLGAQPTTLVRAQTPPEPPVPQVDAVGTYFEITNSEYLNITLTSSETVHIILESVPKTVSFIIERNNTATSTDLTLSGFEPEATYYRYQDGELQEQFTTDAMGHYSYTQDISQGHDVIIQEEESTITINPDGSITPSSAPITKSDNVYTFTGDIDETIAVQINNIVIDGADYTLQAPPGGYNGFYLAYRSGVTIMNVKINGWYRGITPYKCSDIIISGNIITNTVSNGIFLYYGSNNVIYDNTISIGSVGIAFYYSSNNVIYDNTIRNFSAGLLRSIWLMSRYNLIYHNNFIDNVWHEYLFFDNYFYHPDLEQGNYWDDYPGLDDGSGGRTPGDGIGDTNLPWHYDEYPYMEENGWKPPPGEISLFSDTLAIMSLGIVAGAVVIRRRRKYN